MADLHTEPVIIWSNEHELLTALALTALENGSALKHVDPKQARFQRNKTYDPADTLHVQFKAGDLAIVTLTRDEIRSDPSGDALERISEAYGKDNPRAAQLLRDIAKDETPQDYTIILTTKAARESVDAIFAMLSLDAIKVDSESRAPTLVLQYPAFFVDAIKDASTAMGALKYPMQCGWRLLYQWLTARERRERKRLVAEFGHRYADPWFELWLSLVPVARLPEQIVRDHVHPKVEKRGEEATEDEDDESDHEPEPSVALPPAPHEEGEKK
jgi:hypothetical protein